MKLSTARERPGRPRKVGESLVRGVQIKAIVGLIVALDGADTPEGSVGSRGSGSSSASPIVLDIAAMKQLYAGERYRFMILLVLLFSDF